MPGVCFRCHREVYFAEEKLALGKVWHTFCFSCFEITASDKCRKLLDSTTVETQDGELFCKTCISRPEKLINTKNQEAKPSEENPSKDALLRGDCCYCCTRNCFLGSNGAGDGLIGQKSIGSLEEKPRLRGGGRTEKTPLDQTPECVITRYCENNEMKFKISKNEEPHSSLFAACCSSFECHFRDKKKVHEESKNIEKSNDISHHPRIRAKEVQNTVFQDFSKNETGDRRKTIQESKTIEFSLTKDGVEKQKPLSHEREEQPSQRHRVDNTPRKGKPWAYPPLPPHHVPPTRRVSFSDTIFGDEENASLFDQLNEPRYERFSGVFSENRVLDDDDACNDCDCSCIVENDNFPEKKFHAKECSLEQLEIQQKLDRMRGGSGGSADPSAENCVCGKTEKSHFRVDKGKISHTSHKMICGCDGGGCCGSGCRGGCGRLGQFCVPLKTHSGQNERNTTIAKSPKYSPSRAHNRAPSPVRQSVGLELEIPSDRQVLSDVEDDEIPDNSSSRQASSRSKTYGHENFGGGWNCQRCGRKVYQAEMQFAAGAPYHNICFSCYCCRKPLEPLTYQENCGQIYCKQCYIRNFGPQGYGYGIGAGVLQTPM